MKLYKLLKSYTVWAGNNQTVARNFSILLSIIIMASGYFIGLDMYYNDIEVPIWLPLVIVVVNLFFIIAFAERQRNWKGELIRAKTMYFKRIIRYSTTVYGAFLIMICFGNIDFDPERNPQHLIQNWWEISNSSNQYAAVIYGTPPAEKIHSDTKSLKKTSQKKGYKKLTTKRKTLYWVAGFINIFASLTCAVGACAGLCVAVSSGTSIALFLGIWSLLSFIVCFVFIFVGFAKNRKMQNTEPEKRTEPKKKESKFW